MNTHLAELLQLINSYKQASTSAQPCVNQSFRFIDFGVFTLLPGTSINYVLTVAVFISSFLLVPGGFIVMFQHLTISSTDPAQPTRPYGRYNGLVRG